MKEGRDDIPSLETDQDGASQLSLAAVVELLLQDNSTSLASGPWRDQT